MQSSDKAVRKNITKENLYRTNVPGFSTITEKKDRDIMKKVIQKSDLKIFFFKHTNENKIIKKNRKIFSTNCTILWLFKSWSNEGIKKEFKEFLKISSIKWYLPFITGTSSLGIPPSKYKPYL